MAQAKATRVSALAFVLDLGPIGPYEFWVKVLHLSWLACIRYGLSYWTVVFYYYLFIYFIYRFGIF